MTIANKYRIYNLLVVIDFLVHGIIFNNYSIKAEYIILTVFINVFLVIIGGIYWLSQKCPYCHCYLYDRSENITLLKKEEMLVLDPFIYLIIKGECHHCKNKI